MATFTALTTLAGKEKAEALGEALERLQPKPTGVGVLNVEDSSGLLEVGAYFVEAPDEVGLSLLAASLGAKSFVISELPETDWIAHVKRELAPIRVGRFFLYGSHDADKVPSDVVPLAIDAAMAFGTGHHGTTQGCLRALDRLAENGFEAASIADIGCGTAVLAMAAAKIWPAANILASDIDEIAIETSLANLDFNNLTGVMECVVCPGFEDPAMIKAAPYALIFANILKSPLIDLAADIGENTADNGFIILSGILNKQAADVVDSYKNQSFNLCHHDEIGEWSTLTMQKRPR